MNIDKIYLVDALFGIDYFLSLYRFEESNLVVIPNDNNSLLQFIHDIMPNQEIVKLPQITNWLPGTEEGLQKQLSEFIDCKTHVEDLFSWVQPPTQVFFFSPYGAMQTFILLGYLHKKGISLKYTNIVKYVHPELYIESLDEMCLIPRYQTHLMTLSQIAGLKIKAIRQRFWTILGIEEFMPPISICADTWPALAKKYSWGFKNESPDTILWCDTPIMDLPHIDVEKTQQNLIRFFNALLKKGVKIHVKPHSGHDSFAFKGTCLESVVELLPKHFPAELIMHQYSQIYGINSSSLATPVAGRKFALIRLVVFNSKEGALDYQKLFEEVFINRNDIALKTIGTDIIEIINMPSDTIGTPEIQEAENDIPRHVSDKKATILAVYQNNDYLHRSDSGHDTGPGIQNQALTNDTLELISHAAWQIKCDVINKESRSQALLSEAALLNQQGEDLYNKGDMTGALEKFDRALITAPDFTATYNNLGVIYWQTGQIQKSLDCLAKGFAIDAYNHDLIINFGNLLTETGQIHEAKHLYELFLTRYSNDRIIMDAYSSLIQKINMSIPIGGDAK